MQEPQKNEADFGQTEHDRRAASLKAVARELKKIGYIVIVNHRGTGLVVIERETELHGATIYKYGSL